MTLRQIAIKQSFENAKEQVESRTGIPLDDNARKNLTNTLVFWSSVWAAISAVLVVLALTLWKGQFSALASAWLSQGSFLAAFMLLVFRLALLNRAQVYSQRALHHGRVSEVSLLTSLEIVWGVLITFAAFLVGLDLFRSIPIDWRIWLIRIVGTMMIAIGIARLATKRMEKILR